MTTISLKCQCGEVTGKATNITPSSGTRVVCCCSDCQAFTAFLEREAETLDKFGGTEVFQMSQSQLTIDKGHDKLQSMRLTKKGQPKGKTTKLPYLSNLFHRTKPK